MEKERELSSNRVCVHHSTFTAHAMLTSCLKLLAPDFTTMMDCPVECEPSSCLGQGTLRQHQKKETEAEPKAVCTREPVDGGSWRCGLQSSNASPRRHKDGSGTCLSKNTKQRLGCSSLSRMKSWIPSSAPKINRRQAFPQLIQMDGLQRFALQTQNQKTTPPDSGDGSGSKSIC